MNKCTQFKNNITKAFIICNKTNLFTNLINKFFVFFCYYKATRTSKLQKIAIIDFMGENYAILFGKHQSIRGPNLKQNKWIELAQICNELGPPIKDIKGWQRVRNKLKYLNNFFIKF